MQQPRNLNKEGLMAKSFSTTRRLGEVLPTSRSWGFNPRKGGAKGEKGKTPMDQMESRLFVLRTSS